MSNPEKPLSGHKPAELVEWLAKRGALTTFGRSTGRERFAPRVLATVSAAVVLGGIILAGSSQVKSIIHADNKVVGLEANALGGVTRAQLAGESLTEKDAQANPELMVDISVPGHPDKISSKVYGRVIEDLLSKTGLDLKEKSTREILRERGYELEKYVPFKEVHYYTGAQGDGSFKRKLPSRDETVSYIIGGIEAGIIYPGYGEIWAIEQTTGRYYLFIATTPESFYMPDGGVGNYAPNNVKGFLIQPAFVWGGEEYASKFTWHTPPASMPKLADNTRFK